MKRSNIRIAAYYPIAVCLTLGALVVSSELGVFRAEASATTSVNISRGELWNEQQREISFAEKSQIQEPSEVSSRNESALGYEVMDTTTLLPVIK
jgi:hypothetical protein